MLYETNAVIELTDLHNALAAEALNLYQTAFPEAEREPLDELEETVAAPTGAGYRHHFQAVIEDGRVTGIAIFTSFEAQRMGFLRFLAVDEHLRGHGLGAALLHQVVTQVYADGVLLSGQPYLGLCLEVERPETAVTPDELSIRQRRIGFYRRNGGSVMEHIDLVAPPNAPHLPPMPYHLMFLPTPACPIVTPQHEIAMAETILVQGYGVSGDDVYFQHAVAGLMAAS